jgi:hypothetical protein
LTGRTESGDLQPAADQRTAPERGALKKDIERELRERLKEIE